MPSADDSSSRNAGRDLDAVGFTLDEFASLLSKYDYNFKPGDVVNGTVFALESKGAMIDIGAKSTDFALYERGALIACGGIALGGDHVTRDIARLNDERAALKDLVAQK